MPALLGAFIIVLCEGLSFCVTLPVMSYYCQELGAAPDEAARWMGLMFAVLALPKLLTNPLLGSISDRRGRRPLLSLATLGTLAGSAVWALAEGIQALVISRAVVGVFGAQAALAQAVIADVTPPERRAGGMALLGAAFGLALAVGPLLGGFVGETFGNRSVGWLAAAFQVVSLLTIAGMRETVGSGRAAGAVTHPREIEPAHRRAIWLLLGVTLLAMAAMSQINSTFTLVVEHSFGMSEWQAGAALSLFGLVAALAAGAVRGLVRRAGDASIGRLALLILAVGLAGLALASDGWALLLFMALVAVGGAWSAPCISSLLSQRAAPHEQGAINGLSQAATGVGRALGGGSGGWLLAQLGRSAPYGAGALLALAAFTLLVVLNAPPSGAAESREHSSN